MAKAPKATRGFQRVWQARLLALCLWLWKYYFCSALRGGTFAAKSTQNHRVPIKNPPNKGHERSEVVLTRSGKIPTVAAQRVWGYAPPYTPAELLERVYWSDLDIVQMLFSNLSVAHPWAPSLSEPAHAGRTYSRF